MKIQAKILLAFLLLALAPLAGTALLVNENSSRALTEQVLDQLDSVASVQESRLEDIIEQNLERLALVTSRTQLRISLDNYTRDPRPEYQDRMNQILVDARASVPSFRDLHVLLLNGTTVASTNPGAIGANHSNEAFFLRGRTENTPDIFYLDATDRLGVYLSGPLLFNSTLVGVLVIESGVENVLSTVQEYSGLGATGETQVAEREGDGDARFLTPMRFDPEAALNRTTSRDNVSAPIIQALLGVETLLSEGTDYRGVPVLAATRYIERTGWGLVVKIDQAEAFAPIIRMRDVLISVTFASSIAVAFVSWYMARSITKPILEVADAAGAISEGDFQRRARVASADEVGVLARAFNQMAQTLVQTNVELERKVKERTVNLEQEVTERRRAEAALEARTRELARSNEELEQFAYVASHDLQEPLRMVASYTRLLADRYGDKFDADGHEFIGYAVDGAVRMQRLIDDLLAYSRVGRRGNAFELTDMQAVLDRALGNLEAPIRESGAVVTHDPMPTVVADGSELVQVFQNLISNAIKFRSDGAPQIHVAARRADGEWHFSVRDNGIGIDPKDLGRLFAMFQRLHGRTEYPGSGIGLAICKRIVERHGGRIWAESLPAKGSTFHLTIPTKGGPDP